MNRPAHAPAAPPTLHLVDASMYVFRAWQSMPDEFHDADGWPMVLCSKLRYAARMLSQPQPRLPSCSSSSKSAFWPRL